MRTRHHVLAVDYLVGLERTGRYKYVQVLDQCKQYSKTGTYRQLRSFLYNITLRFISCFMLGLRGNIVYITDIVQILRLRIFIQDDFVYRYQIYYSESIAFSSIYPIKIVSLSTSIPLCFLFYACKCLLNALFMQSFKSFPYVCNPSFSSFHINVTSVLV